MKSILIITNYFPPEIGAASNRIFQLADGLQKHDFKVSVITPLPNYPKGKIFKGYRGTFKQTTTENNITIHRLWIYASHSKNKVWRLLAMLSYSFSLIGFFLWNKIPNKVIIQSPPLLVAFTCMLFLRNRKRKLILNVSDLWPIAGLQLGAFKKNFSYRCLEKMERFNYKKATMILGQSEEIHTHITAIVPNKETFLYRNYPNFKVPDIAIENSSTEVKIKLVYAGLLGVAQAVFKLCKALDYTPIEFHIYGAGAEQKQIEELISSNPKLSVVYHGEVTRKALHNELLKYDIAIIPLCNRIYGSVPSKLFEYARLGLPVLYFGGGEGETIVKENHLGWIAEAGNYSDLNKLLSTIYASKVRLGYNENIKETAAVKFNFNTQLDAFISKL